ncbi:hypothetical protein UFOVP1604_250 [uncultured Caudovirales phage]|uniref:Uncharacterized protein n=1 Tax=uncultured Caudovirales phage TaxID=2100421 RepID=A0A6J5SXL6_9CAUD|nr:hypothetical protein UFOVP1604_250 [uncultured Caudovirales phage]
MTSRFVTLSDYCILEFMMTPLGDPAPNIVNSDYYFVKNNNVDLYQIYNTDADAAATKNARGSSVVPIGESRFVKVDLTSNPIYTAYDPNIIESSVSPSLSSALVMDTMRFHFASGFNFTEVENIVVGARVKLNNLKQLQTANVLINAESYQDLLTFNTRPLFLANTIYDKYVDIKVPNSAYLDADFTQFGVDSFESVVTEGTGLIAGSPITVSLAEVNYEPYYADNGEIYNLYRVVSYFEGSVPQTNEFDSLGAVIQEATDGDYIEFFATWNGAFPDQLISTLDSQGSGNDWIFVHQLQVYEQIGGNLVPSGNFLVYQEENFDAPLSYRPILKEAGFAVSMSIDYTLRLLNKNTGDQVIRTGSMSLFNPNKYGKHLAKLQLAEAPQSLKVYNKIVQKNIDITNLFTGKKLPPAATTGAAPGPITYVDREVQVAVPTFYKQANIRISQKNALLGATNGSAELIYGQGELIIPIDPTDNFIKIGVYEESVLDPGTQTPANLNNNSKFVLNFGADAKYSYSSLVDPAFENPSQGQIAFRIPKDQARKILDLSDQMMYISLIAEDGTETLLYTGKWLPSSDYANILKATEAAKNALLNDPAITIAGLNTTIQTLISENDNLRARLASGTKVYADSPMREDNVQNINLIAGI